MVTDKEYYELVDRLAKAEQRIDLLERQQKQALARTASAINDPNSVVSKALAKNLSSSRTHGR